MPIFEYSCNDCSTRFEIFHKGAENQDLIECPECASRSAVKQFSAFSATASATYSSSSSCESGSCATPSFTSPCAGGMCGLQ